MNTKGMKVRRLTAEEIGKLSAEEEILAPADSEMLGTGTGALAPAHLTKGGGALEGGSVEYRTVFGTVGHTLASDVERAEDHLGLYVADKDGPETLPVVQSAGLFLHVALFVPEATLDGVERFYAAIRDAFGEGKAQVWSNPEELAALVPDAKLDVYQVAARGRKGENGPKRELVKAGVYPQRVPFLPIAPTYRLSTESHQEVVDDTPTI